jgi:hypothetical protein
MTKVEQLLAAVVETMVEEVVDKKLKTTEKGSRPWNRENAKWDKQEEEVLIQRVSVFLDSAALAHRRTRGGIMSRLNKLMKEGRLCGLRTSETVRTKHRRGRILADDRNRF